MSTTGWAIVFLAAFVLPWLFVRVLGTPTTPPDDSEVHHTVNQDSQYGANSWDETPGWMRALGLQPLTNREIRQARMRANGGCHSHAEWIALCEYYGWRCLRCKRKRRLSKDHIVPVLLGGSSDIDNIQPLCRSCNSSKGATTIDYRYTPQRYK